MSKLLFLALLLAGLWFWRDSLQAREIVLDRCRRYCNRYNYQLLDATVAIHRLRLRRTPRGNLALQRHYLFEYSIAGVERRRGYATVFDGKMLDIYLEQEDGSRLLENTGADDGED